MPIPKILNLAAQQPVFPCPPAFGIFVGESSYVLNAVLIVYTVPVDYTLYITDWNLCISTTTVGYGCIAEYSSIGVFIHRLGNIRLQQPGTVTQGYSLTTPYVIPAGNTIRINSSNVNTETSCAFHGWIFKTG